MPGDAGRPRPRRRCGNNIEVDCRSGSRASPRPRATNRAAAGVYALDHHVDRLADDHRRAKRLAVGLAEAGLAVDPDRVETNFVQIDVAPLTKEDAMARLAEHGVGLSATIHPTVLRAVTHLDVGDEDVDGALDAIPRALGAAVRA